MSSFPEILRNACYANGLGTSGSSAVLLKRLGAAGKSAPATKSKATNAKKKKAVTKSTSTSCKGGICKPKTMAPIKMTGNGTRMSASYYFHEVCDGNISRCKPQIIQESSGRKRLKKIKIVCATRRAPPRALKDDTAHHARPLV